MHFASSKPTYLFYIITLLTHPTSFFILHSQHIKIIYLLPTCYYSNTVTHGYANGEKGGNKNNNIMVLQEYLFLDVTVATCIVFYNNR